MTTLYSFPLSHNRLLLSSRQSSTLSSRPLRETNFHAPFKASSERTLLAHRLKNSFFRNHFEDPGRGERIILKCIFNLLNAELYAICYLLVLLGAYPILHVSRLRVKK
jgi:hypothetical protein